MSLISRSPPGAVVLLVGVERPVAVAARLLPHVLEEGERGPVVLEAAAPAGQRRLAVEDLVVGRVRAADGIAVEEDREVREALVDPGELTRVGVVVQQVLELVGHDALDREVGRVRVADHLVPVPRVDDDDVHAVLLDELRGEVADRVLRRVAVVVGLVADVVGEQDERVAVRVGWVGEPDRAVVLRVDLDDAGVAGGADELLAEAGELRVADLEVRRRVGLVVAGRELVVRVRVPLRIGALDAGDVTADRALGRVDVDGRAVRRRSGEVALERERGRAAGDVVADRDLERRVAGRLLRVLRHRRGGARRGGEDQRGAQRRRQSCDACGQESPCLVVVLRANARSANLPAGGADRAENRLVTPESSRRSPFRPADRCAIRRADGSIGDSCLCR